MSSPIKTLAYLFRRGNAPRPVLLLGAGASFHSGIPLAEALVRKIAQSAYARERLGMDVNRCPVMPSDWKPYLESQTWFIWGEAHFAENFPLAVENLLTPREIRRAFFQEIIQSSEPISDGYHAIARLMVRRLIGCVLTTNFDGLIGDALRQQVPRPPSIVEVKTPADLIQLRLINDFQIVFLHGSVEHYSDQNLRQETEKLDDRLVRRVRPLLSESPLIVIGYRGAEPSVMQHLLEEGTSECGGYRNGIYWCVRSAERLHDNVRRLNKELGSNFILLEIKGFDELMVSLDKELESDSWYTGSVGFLKGEDVHAGQRFDLQPLEGASVSDLDHDLLLSTLADYSKRLEIPPITRENYTAFLEGQGFLHRRADTLVPSRGCFLLFGIDVEKRFPQARIAFTQDEKRRVVIEGNLITQHRRIRDLLTSEEVSPLIRLKGDRVAEDQPAFPARALAELTVNLLVHRDYENADYSRIDFAKGRSLSFENPGGLLPSVSRQVQFDLAGKFKPVRGLTEMRNPLLADIFYGIGSMDKAGSGLADVQDFLFECGGRAEYAVGAENKTVRVTVFQPVQEAPETSRVARRVVQTELYVTNLLPFRVLPKAIYLLPLRNRFAEAPLFEPRENPREMPIVIRHAGTLWSFADLRNHSEFSDKRGFLNRIEEISSETLLKSKDSRNRFVWLVNKHWEFFLRRFPLIVEGAHRKRAYFHLIDGDHMSIPYLSRTGRRVSRDVVKRRGDEPNFFHENEAIRYGVEEFLGEWALQIRPTYVFTRIDGKTPLSQMAQTRRATRRFKFDRNPSVDNDLTFWARYLSDAQPTINIGNVGVSDLILDSEFCSIDVPKPGAEKSHFETAN